MSINLANFGNIYCNMFLHMSVSVSIQQFDIFITASVSVSIQQFDIFITVSVFDDGKG